MTDKKEKLVEIKFNVAKHDLNTGARTCYGVVVELDKKGEFLVGKTTPAIKAAFEDSGKI